LGDLLERAFDAPAQLIALFTREVGLGAGGRQLIPEALDF
jgi:hypothetical protein